MSEIILLANTSAELRGELAELDTHVPARSEGRRNHHVERYSIAHLLATLPVERFLFPLTLVHRDKPDFLLTMSDGDVGIEHTEAVPVNVARAQVMRERGLGSEVYFIPHVQPGEPRKEAEELRREIEADDAGGGWYGDSPEREWAEAIAHCVGEKLPKAMADGFARYAVNWLIIYDNWPLPMIDFTKAAPYLAQLLMEGGAYLVFDAIFVHDESNMCEFRPSFSPVIYTLVRPEADVNASF